MRVLVVDDDKTLVLALSRGLAREGFAVDGVFDADSAVHALSVHDYDCVVLDRVMPDGSGDEVCAWLERERPRVNVLMLTVRDSVADKVDGFSVGAHDYLTKPFAFPEVVARLRALARRPSVSSAVLRISGVRLDPQRHRATLHDRDLALTPKEFAVLETLMRSAGEVLSAETLLEKVWDQNADPFTNTVRVTLATLRRKLDAPLIETLRGVGYRFIDDAEVE